MKAHGTSVASYKVEVYMCNRDISLYYLWRVASQSCWKHQRNMAKIKAWWLDFPPRILLLKLMHIITLLMQMAMG